MGRRGERGKYGGGRNVERGELQVERYGGREWDEEGREGGEKGREAGVRKVERGEKKVERPG